MLKMPARTKEKAGANEMEDIKAIVEALHSKSPSGISLATKFKDTFGLEILDARTRKGNRGVHYDFQILVGPAPGVWKNVEHKGSQRAAPIKSEDTPWAAGVQFHNGGCEKYTIARDYARIWYDTHVGSGTLKAEWGLEAPIPSFEDWFKKDAKVQSDPKTAFGKELKRKVREARGPKGSLLEKREVVNTKFHPSEADFETLKAEVLATLKEVLDQKDYWLTIAGDITGVFHCAWYSKFSLGSIQKITMTKEKDIWFHFVCSETSFKAILRFGKGAGFSNIRLDAR
jgi:hypothetical protein